MLHSVWGGIGAVKGGQEIWAVVPPEVYGGLKRLRDNDPKIDVPNTSETDINPKTSFVDGSPTLLDLRDKDGAGKVYLYVPMRRGGRYIYALDVTNVKDPKFLWKRGCFESGVSTICDPGFSELGQTWSGIRHASVDIGGTETRVLLFGAGYDPAAEDGLPAGAAAQGRGILMLNPVTGDPLWVVGPSASCGGVSGCTPLDVTEMTYPIPGKLALIDTDKSDTRILADRLYAADTGGNIWVGDLRDIDPQKWTVSKLAELGGSGANARKFLYGPDVVDNSNPVCETQSSFDYAVLIGSGDREHPLDISVYRVRLGDDSLPAVSDHFYMLKDKLVETRALPLRESDLARIGNPNDSLSETEGWWLPLDSQEKIVGNSVTLQGSTIFATSRPPSPTIDPNTCAGNLGTARIYQVRYCDAAPLADFSGDGRADLYTTVPGGGLLPPPVPFQIEVSGQGGQTESITGVILGTQLVKVEPGESLFSAQRTYWFKETE
jgi:type IV pilus assembly protein PilY1